MTKTGFALLFSVLIASIMLSIALAIFNIVYKELILSSAVKNSQFAFYAADAGLECALYWDYKGKVFATSTDSVLGASGVTCNGTDITAAVNTPISRTADAATTLFYLNFLPDAYCVSVTVRKESIPTKRTTIEGRGYNAGYDASTGDCSGSLDRKEERGLLVTY